MSTAYPAGVATVSIQSVTSGESGSPGVITRDNALTVALVAAVTDSAGGYVQLPSDASIGDVVEVYDQRPSTGGPFYAVNVVPASGDGFTYGVDTSRPPGFFRRVAANTWSWNNN